ncbi:hypothetical protein DL89DRAFT_171448 [Linderina pennispora]|uniref:ARM repeat-containing protein n=1 Tax=Linderina pennispora TaxID=61395 RepID=A0A1Y1W6Y7_9FUNG|nr:uncharacterized protein DL89DRAFT_171448 [Linderina pennispora]ORX69098.1 hypothetical protein DL89DRAFT_171448 [Linderina pennispora]
MVGFLVEQIGLNSYSPALHQCWHGSRWAGHPLPVRLRPTASLSMICDNCRWNGQSYRKPPAAVRARAIDALAAAVVAVYGDARKQPSSKSTAMGELASRARLLATASIVQNKATDTDDDPSESDGQLQFQRLLRRLAELRHTEHLVIASALEALFADIVMSCASMLQSPAFSTAVEACLILAITRKSTEGDSDTLCRIADKCWTEGMGPVYRHRIGELAESCFSLFEQYITGNSESQRRDVLCLLAGYMRVLGPSDTQSLMLQWWSTRGVLSLIASLTVSLPGTSLLISEVSSTSDPKESVDYVLDFYRTPELKLALDRFVGQVVESFTARRLRTLLIGLLETQPDSVHSQMLWLLSRITSLGESEYKDGEDAEYQPVVEYIANYFNKLQSASDEETSDSIQTIDAASQDVLQSCMVLNTISTVVPRIGTSIAYYMDSLLFPLLETTTAQSPVVREQAQQALAVLARTSGTVSIPDMLRSNIDYIVEGCSRQLRIVDLHPKVFNILIGCVDLVGEGILLYMDDVVEDTLDVCESWMDDDVMMTSALRFLGGRYAHRIDVSTAAGPRCPQTAR